MNKALSAKANTRISVSGWGSLLFSDFLGY
jgi:hypothetical protein